MRNESLRMCTRTDTRTDADERIAPDDLSESRPGKGAHDCCYRFTTRNYTNNTAIADFQPCEPSDLNTKRSPIGSPTKVRFFPNRRGGKFQGKVHELVNQSLEQQGIRVLDCPVPVHHYPRSRRGPHTRKARTVSETWLKGGIPPGDPNAFIELGAVCRSGDWANAAASKSSPETDARNACAAGPRRRAAHAEAPDEAKRALQLASKSTAPSPRRGETSRRAGRRKQWDVACDCFRNALKFDPAWPDAHRYLSVAIEGAGRLEEAVEESRTVLEKNPNDSECLKLYIHQILRLGRRPEARTLLLGLIDRGAKSADIYNALAELFFYDNLLEESKQYFLSAAQAGLPAAYNNLGVVLFKQDRFVEAKQAFEQCLAADPAHPGAISVICKGRSASPRCSASRTCPITRDDALRR